MLGHHPFRFIDLPCKVTFMQKFHTRQS